MILGVGIDIVEIPRIRKMVSERKNFVGRILSEAEIRSCGKAKDRFERIACCFAAKEAVIKALGTKNLPLKSIETGNRGAGMSEAKISGGIFKNIGIMVSISNTQDYAYAAAVAVKKAEG